MQKCVHKWLCFFLLFITKLMRLWFWWWVLYPLSDTSAKCFMFWFNIFSISFNFFFILFGFSFFIFLNCFPRWVFFIVKYSYAWQTFVINIYLIKFEIDIFISVFFLIFFASSSSWYYADTEKHMGEKCLFQQEMFFTYLVLKIFHFEKKEKINKLFHDDILSLY